MLINKRLLNFIERISVVVLLLWAEIINVPSEIVTIINLLSYGIVFLLVVGKWKRIAFVFARDKVLLFFLFIALVSVFWSNFPDATLTHLRGLIRSTIFGAYLANCYSFRQQIRLLSWTVSISIVLNIIICLTNPSYGIGMANGVMTWQGFYAFKQYLARFMVIAVTVYLFNLFRNKQNHWLSLLGILLATFLIIMSTSKTALILVLLMVCLLPLYKIAKQESSQRIVILFSIVVLLGSIVCLLIVNLETILVDILGKDIEFNGRVPLWNLAFEKILDRPFFGYGYAAFWISDAGYDIFKHTWANLAVDGNKNFHIHNGYIDLTLQLGLIGLLTLIASIFTILKRVIYLLISTKTRESLCMLQIMAIILVVNASEVITFLSESSIFWILYVSIALTSSMDCKQIKRSKHIITANT
jgi:exopolysaccharide production protein ExoQ